MNARKMFEKLGYEYTSNKIKTITYRKKETNTYDGIYWCCIDFELMPNGKYGVLCPKTLYNEEIKAIHQQLKELNGEG